MKTPRPVLSLGTRVLAPGGRPYVIAEIGVNHGGSLVIARQLIEQAARGGADAAKFQSYKADSLASKHAAAYWDTNKEPTRNQHELFRKYDGFGPSEYRALARHCQVNGIDFLSTPFDDEAVDFLDPLQSFYKIASADITNVPLLRRVAGKGKPVLLSTGASSLEEIRVALACLERAGCPSVVLLHCILNYPTLNSDANLRMISGLIRTFPRHLVGYSDHTMPDEAMTSLVAAHLLGAVVIEKHFTHDKNLPGNDHYHAMDVTDLARFVSSIDLIHTLLGPDEFKAPIAAEEPSRRNARRSIALTRDVECGHRLEAPDLICLRAGAGLSAANWDDVIGRRTCRNLQRGALLEWMDIAERQD